MSAKSVKQQVWLNEFLKSGNATEAARLAGYKHPNVQGPRIKNHMRADIKQAVDDGLLDITPSVKKNAPLVYLIRESWKKMVKIGITRNVKDRLATLQTCCPQELELIATIKCNHPKKLEKELHDRFSHKRIRGEWFLLSGEDVRLICDYHNAITSFDV